MSHSYTENTSPSPYLRGSAASDSYSPGFKGQTLGLKSQVQDNQEVQITKLDSVHLKSVKKLLKPVFTTRILKWKREEADLEKTHKFVLYLLKKAIKDRYYGRLTKDIDNKVLISLEKLEHQKEVYGRHLSSQKQKVTQADQKEDSNVSSDKLSSLEQGQKLQKAQSSNFKTTALKSVIDIDYRDSAQQKTEQMLQVENYEGLCPYLSDKAFYFSKEDQTTLHLGTYKGGELYRRKSLKLYDAKTKGVTMIKVLDDILAIGYTDGSFQLIELQKTNPQVLEVAPEAGGCFPRDFYLHKQAQSSRMCLLVLYVNQNQNERSYSMGQFLVSRTEEETSPSKFLQRQRSQDFQENDRYNFKIDSCSEIYELFNIENKNEKYSRYQDRREFYWQEQIRPLGTNSVYFQLAKYRVGILDMELCLSSDVFYKFHTGLRTQSLLNWVFLSFKETDPIAFARGDPVETVKPEKESIELIVVNLNGIHQVQMKNTGEVFSRCISNPYQNKAFSSKKCRPFDVVALQNNILVVAGEMGLFKMCMNHSFEDWKSVCLSEDKFYQLIISNCGKVMAATGCSQEIHLYETPQQTDSPEVIDETNDLRVICSLPYNNIEDIRMNSDQIFFKLKAKGSWCVVDLQRSEIIKTIEPKLRLSQDTRIFQLVLFDKIQLPIKDKNEENDKLKRKVQARARDKKQKENAKDKVGEKDDAFKKADDLNQEKEQFKHKQAKQDQISYAVGIISNRKEVKERLNVTSFYGGQVTAVNLTSGPTKGKEFELMSQKEAEKNFEVLSVTLHKNILTWLVARRQVSLKRGRTTQFQIEEEDDHVEVNLFARQSDLCKPFEEYSEVELTQKDLDNTNLEGFYLSVKRENLFNKSIQPIQKVQTQQKNYTGKGYGILVLFDPKNHAESKYRHIVFPQKETMLKSVVQRQNPGRKFSIKVSSSLKSENKVTNQANLLKSESLFDEKSDTNKQAKVLIPEEIISVDFEKPDCHVLNDTCTISVEHEETSFLFQQHQKPKAETEDKKWKIPGKGIRMSPSGKHVVFAHNDKLFVAKLNPDFKYQPDGTEGKEKDKSGLLKCCKGAKKQNEKEQANEPLFNKKFIKNAYQIGEQSPLKYFFWLSPCQISDGSQQTFDCSETFAIGDCESMTQDPQSYLIYSSGSGKAFCRFQLRQEYEFLKNTTNKHRFAPNATGILDKKAKKIYDTSLLSLLHLGATHFCLQPKLLQKRLLEEFKVLRNEGKIHEKFQQNQLLVLGKHAPTLFYSSLQKLEQTGANQERQQEVINYRVFQNTVLELNIGTTNPNVKIQNMFQYLCNRNDKSLLLQHWLKEESNYFSDGKTFSPMSLTTGACAETILEWFKSIDKQRAREIYTGFYLEELSAIQKFHFSMITKFILTLSFEFTEKLSFDSGILKGELFQTKKLDSLDNLEFQEKITKALFECDDDKGRLASIKKFVFDTMVQFFSCDFIHRIESQEVKDKKIERPRTGNPIRITASYMKLPLNFKSEASRELIETIKLLAVENQNLYKITLIQKIIDYKYKQTRILREFMFCFYLGFLIFLYNHDWMEVNQVFYSVPIRIFGLNMTTPTTTVDPVTVFGIAFLAKELAQLSRLNFAAVVKFDKKSSIHLKSQLGFWNFVDWLQLASFAYFVQWKTSVSYAILKFISYLNLLQYLRLFSWLRFFIELLKQVLFDPHTLKFLLVTFLMVTSFAMYMHVLDQEAYSSMMEFQNQEGALPIPVKQKTRAGFYQNQNEEKLLVKEKEIEHPPSVYTQIKDFTFIAFGTFDYYDVIYEDRIDQDSAQYAMFNFAGLLMCIYMMNLLIGILSNSMNQILIKRDIVDYAAKTEILYELELIRTSNFFSDKMFRGKEEQKVERQHIIWAERTDVDDNENEADHPLTTQLKIVSRKMEDHNEKVDSKIKDLNLKMDQRMENLEQKMDLILEALKKNDQK